MKLDSYKITVTNGGCAYRFPQRRETREGAEKLADKLRGKGKHGMVEAVWFDDHSVYFEQIRKF